MNELYGSLQPSTVKVNSVGNSTTSESDFEYIEIDEEGNSSLQPFEVADDKDNASTEQSTIKLEKTSPKKFYSCDVCHKNISWNHQYQHKRFHFGIKPHKCDVCAQSFSKKQSLKDHLQRHHDNNKSSLTSQQLSDFEEECGDVNLSQNQSSLEYPKTTNSDESECYIANDSIAELSLTTSKKTYQCEICRKNIIWKNRFRHLRLHSDVKPYQCDVCSREFTEKDALTQHSHKAHSDIKIYFTCEICNRDYENKQSFQKHCKTHTDKRSYICDECGNSFRTQHELKKHCYSLHQEKKIECDICGLKFICQSHLKVHFRTHTGEKPFSCDECDKSYNTGHCLRHHIRTVHEKQLYYCNICNKGVKTKNFLKEHIALHGGDKPYECEICNKRFSFKRYLNQHRFIHTGLKPHKCNICSKSFSRKDNLKTHLTFHSKKESIKTEIDEV